MMLDNRPERDFMDPSRESMPTEVPSGLPLEANHLQSNLKPKLSSESPGKARKKKMSVPRRILRLLESSKRLHFQNVSLSKKRQLCINRCIPDLISPKCQTLQSQARYGCTSLSLQGPSRNSILKKQKVPPKDRKGSLLGQCLKRTSNEASERAFCASKTNGSCGSRGADHDSKEKIKEFHQTHEKLKKEVLAIDCEMVGIGPKGRFSALARCSIVDFEGRTIYDQYVKPDQPITDYRTRWSGIRERHMKDAKSFEEARTQVLNIIRGKIVVGHAIFNDFEALGVVHPPEDTRDTSKCHALAELYSGALKAGQYPGLKKLAKRLLDMEIQRKEHCSVEDAKATMLLYKLVERQWEEEIGSSFPDQQFRTSFLDDHFWPDDLF